MKLQRAIGVTDPSLLKSIMKQEIENLDATQLPLQRGLAHSSCVSHSPFSAIILNVSDQTTSLDVKTGIQYTGIVAGCSCADDPSLVDEINEYCELLFSIDKTTAETSITLVQD